METTPNLPKIPLTYQDATADGFLTGRAQVLDMLIAWHGRKCPGSCWLCEVDERTGASRLDMGQALQDVLEETIAKDRARPDLYMAQAIVNLLNSALELDRPAVGALIANRVPCNLALAEHPVIECGAAHGGYTVGLLGFLNGLCRASMKKAVYGPIEAVFEDAPKGELVMLERFVVADRFLDETNPPPDETKAVNPETAGAEEGTTE